MPATIWRESHKPYACSAGSTALICRNVNALTSAAARDRSDPRAGTPSAVMRLSQQKMVTLVNGKVVAARSSVDQRLFDVARYVETPGAPPNGARGD